MLHSSSSSFVVSRLMAVALLLCPSVLLVQAQPNHPFPLSSSRSITGDDRPDRQGEAGTPLFRMYGKVSYMDGMGAMDDTLPNPRTISQQVVAQPGLWANDRGLSDMVWAWGQWLDHDIDLTEADGLFGNADFDIPSDDPGDILWNSGCNQLKMTRSQFVGEPRQQVNLITAFIDASNVYGSDYHRADSLRTFQGGKLKTSNNGTLLPFNTMGLENAGGANDQSLFACGDIRCNEQIGLIAMHTLFVREHNRLANKIQEKWPDAGDEEIYQLARKFVSAEQQIITYKEFLPALLGGMAPDMRKYWGFTTVRPAIPAITNEFSTFAFRMGHSMLSPNLQLADKFRGNVGSISLRDAFFRPGHFNAGERVDELIIGFTTQFAQEIDVHVIDDVRNFLFSGDGQSTACLDLPALNIHRGRDHGLMSYNNMRKAYGLYPKHDFYEVTSDPAVADALAYAYNNTIDALDPWVGALAEDHIGGASVGELLATAISDQFFRLMHGDPFFWKNDPDLKKPGINQILNLHTLTLAQVMQNNLDVDIHPFHNVFFV